MCKRQKTKKKKKKKNNKHLERVCEFSLKLYIHIEWIDYIFIQVFVGGVSLFAIAFVGMGHSLLFICGIFLKEPF